MAMLSCIKVKNKFDWKCFLLIYSHCGRPKTHFLVFLGKANELLGEIKQTKITMTSVDNGVEGSKNRYS